MYVSLSVCFSVSLYIWSCTFSLCLSLSSLLSKEERQRKRKRAREQESERARKRESEKKKRKRKRDRERETTRNHKTHQKIQQVSATSERALCQPLQTWEKAHEGSCENASRGATHCNTLQHTSRRAGGRADTRCTHELLICMTWLVYICVTWPIRMCEVTDRRALIRCTHDLFALIRCTHDLFACVKSRIHMCPMTHSCVWHDSFICVAWLLGHWTSCAGMHCGGRESVCVCVWERRYIHVHVHAFT